MSKRTIKERAQALLTLVQELVRAPGLTWVDASNAVYGPGGPYVRLFPTEAERVAVEKSKEGKDIATLIHDLPTPPLRPWPKGEKHSGVMIPVRKSAARRPRVGAGNRTR